MRHRLNAPQVVHEIFEDEVILVNLEAGAYYSLDGTAARALTCLLSGVRSEDLAERMAAEFDGSPETIGEDLKRFVARLEEERLVCESPEDGTTQEFAAAAGERGPWVAPELHKYTDMRDLLLLDPIHDVDDSGWPARPPEPR